MSRRSAISVVIPAYNEAENIQETLRALYGFLEPRFDDFELLVIDDGSQDSTARLTEELATNAPINPQRLRVIRHEQNRGYGGALRTGFYSARFEKVLLFPADRQFVVEEIQLLIDSAAGCKKNELFVIWPYRADRAEGVLRRLNAAAYRWLIGKALGVSGVNDIDCGMKLYSRELFYKIPKLMSEGALIDAEILTHCRKQRITIKQLPVGHLPRPGGEATGANFKVIMRMFTELSRFRKSLR